MLTMPGLFFLFFPSFPIIQVTALLSKQNLLEIQQFSPNFLLWGLSVADSGENAFEEINSFSNIFSTFPLTCGRLVSSLLARSGLNFTKRVSLLQLIRLTDPVSYGIESCRRSIWKLKLSMVESFGFSIFFSSQRFMQMTSCADESMASGGPFRSAEI